jgi:hypothetical protein
MALWVLTLGTILTTQNHVNLLLNPHCYAENTFESLGSRLRLHSLLIVEVHEA